MTTGAKNPGMVAMVLDMPVSVPAKFGANSCKIIQKNRIKRGSNFIFKMYFHSTLHQMTKYNNDLNQGKTTRNLNISCHFYDICKPTP